MVIHSNGNVKTRKELGVLIRHGNVPVWVALGGMAVAWLGLILFVHRSYPLVHDGVVESSGVLSFVLCLPAVALYISKKIGPRTMLFSMLISQVVGVVAIGAILFLNGWLDNSEPVHVEILIKSKNIGGDADSKIYYIGTAPFSPSPSFAARKATFRVAKDLFDDIQPNKTHVSFTWREGFFELPWRQGELQFRIPPDS